MTPFEAFGAKGAGSSHSGKGVANRRQERALRVVGRTLGSVAVAFLLVLGAFATRAYGYDISCLGSCWANRYQTACDGSCNPSSVCGCTGAGWPIISCYCGSQGWSYADPVFIQADRRDVVSLAAARRRIAHLRVRELRERAARALDLCGRR